MYALAVAGMMGSGFAITLAECFVFSSLIVAVDPVAVRLFSFICRLFIVHDAFVRTNRRTKTHLFRQSYPDIVL